MTAAQRLTETVRREALAQGKAEGRAEGVAEGRAKGVAEGRTVGRAELLLRQVLVKFGPLSNEVSRRILGASPAELDAWADRVLTTPSLDELFR